MPALCHNSLFQLLDNSGPLIFYAFIAPQKRPIGIFWKQILKTTRNKRWDGKIDNLPVDYLNGVLEKMQAYGDRVQFSYVAGGPQPGYQVINPVGKTMAFDRNHHLLTLQGEEFTGPNATAIMGLDQVQRLISGIGTASRTGTRGVRVARKAAGGTGETKTAKARQMDMYAAQRYEYFRNNRQSLPPTISEHTEEITELMTKGKSVEEAFGEIVSKYYG
ncbi:hypothetical protein [Noviherbaspirillum malthae]|uniref:hypothetical protein n=1 Tax=Noviherbaspirillum malthae TaxID=1260987 RepID=UPI001E56E9FE|nr:hypothetical protein [Noviherbaspirillum malthae]